MKRRSFTFLVALMCSITSIAQSIDYKELSLFTTSDKQNTLTQPTELTFDSIIYVSKGVNIAVSLKKETLLYQNGKKQFVRYYRGNNRFGTWSYYSVNGELKYSLHNFEDYYVINTYFTNNNIQNSRKYQNNQQNLLSNCQEEQYYPNGSMYGYGELTPLKIANNVNLIEDGKWRFYHPNGERESKGKYVEGKKDGVWIFYNKNGIKRKSIRFKDGNIVSQKQY